jgi:hypothetical protein
MSSDRGSTMQRGAGPDLEQQPAWAAPTSPADRKLPSAPRERKPLLAVLAVLLIVLGAAAAGLIVVKSGHKVAAIQISHQVQEGQRLSLADMQEVQIAAGDGISYVPWNEASQVAQTFAATTIPAGTLLTPSMASTADALPAGKDIIGLALKDGQMPAGLTAGDHVDIYEVSDNNESCPGAPGSTLARDAVVLSNPRSSGTAGGGSGVVDVKVALAPASAGIVACSAANGIVGIAILPAGGAG